MFRTWFKKLTNANESQQPAAPRGALAVEPLEDRAMMSVVGLGGDVPQIERFVTPGEIRMLVPAVQVATAGGTGQDAVFIKEVDPRPADTSADLAVLIPKWNRDQVTEVGSPDTQTVGTPDTQPVVAEVGRDDPFFRSVALSQKV